MTKYLSILFLICGLYCQAQKSVIRQHVTINVYTYQYENKTKGAAIPELKSKSKLRKYQRRFDYLLMNVPEIHTMEKTEERNAMFDLYPDKSAIKKRYLEKLVQDKKLTAYFEEAIAPIDNPKLDQKKTYTADELMEVASKFFYCDQVKPDTSVQSHVCIGLNGVREGKWEKDYTLLAAFCFEAIFADFANDTSQISDTYTSEKNLSCKKFRNNITTLDKYLEDVRLDLFERMKNNAIVKERLLAYYELNKDNLAFKII